MLKQFIEKVSFFSPSQHYFAKFSILWTSGNTDFYDWYNYPYQPDLSKIKPWYEPYNRLVNTTCTLISSKFSLSNLISNSDKIQRKIITNYDVELSNTSKENIVPNKQQLHSYKKLADNNYSSTLSIFSTAIDIETKQFDKELVIKTQNTFSAFFKIKFISFSQLDIEFLTPKFFKDVQLEGACNGLSKIYNILRAKFPKLSMLNFHENMVQSLLEPKVQKLIKTLCMLESAKPEYLKFTNKAILTKDNPQPFLKMYFSSTPGNILTDSLISLINNDQPNNFSLSLYGDDFSHALALSFQQSNKTNFKLELFDPDFGLFNFEGSIDKIISSLNFFWSNYEELSDNWCYPKVLLST